MDSGKNSSILLGQVDEQTDLGPASVVHHFFSGESLPVHPQQELEEIPGRKQKTVGRGDSLKFAGKGVLLAQYPQVIPMYSMLL